MNHFFKKLLWVAAFFGLTLPAYSLVVIPTFDTSISGDPNGAAMEAAITNAIRVFETKIADNQTVKILYTNDPSVALGENDSFFVTVSYSSYLTALRSRARSANDTNALSNLPVSTTNPVNGGTKINVPVPLAVLLGLFTFTGSDSTIRLNMSLMNFTRPPGDPNKFDLQQVTEHEMDEVFGTPSSLPDSTTISPMDLFRYTTNLARTFTTSGDNAYFSVDGTNLLARFNMDPDGDYGDWWSSTGVNWAPPGQLPHPQVQDAFSPPDTQLDLGPNELAMLDVIGWTLTVTADTNPPVLHIVRSGVNKFALSWTNTATGYSLQERTNLIAGAWLASLTGTTNPAAITSTNTQKFYRLFKAAAPAIEIPQAVVSQGAEVPQLQMRVRGDAPW